MIIKGLLDECFNDYKKASMYIVFPYCTFKCDRECGRPICQNSSLAKEPTIEVSVDLLYKRYANNPLTEAIVLAGLEPFDSWNDLLEFVQYFRQRTDDDIVIYTGYEKCEIVEQIMMLAQYKNIIVKFGRFIPDDKERYDEVLGVTLASHNQYAEVISND